MDREAVIELMARVDCEAVNGVVWDDLSEEEKAQWKDPERAKLEALEEMGQGVTPGKPTEEMRAAAARINHARDEEIYRAMHDSRPSRPQGEG